MARRIPARLKTIPTLFLVYATVLVAFFLRVYRLADKNIWWDEGWSLWLAKQDLGWIALRTAADEHPPLHYWMLHFWDAVAGWNAYAGRFMSVAFGVLTVALLYRIGTRVGGKWIGVLAAFLLALARFHIWWSQDIKNYTPSIFFVFAALWFALILLERPLQGVIARRDSEFRRNPDEAIPNSAASLRAAGFAAKQSPTMTGNQHWGLPRRPTNGVGLLAMTPIAGYAVCAALALWTHYLVGLVLLALNLYAAIVFVREYDRSRAARALWPSTGAWLAANGLGALLFLPWLYLYLGHAAAWSAAPQFDFGLFLRLVAIVLPFGVTTNIDNYVLLTLALTLLAAVGAVGTFLRRVPNAPASRIQLSTSNIQSPTSNLHPLLFALIVILPPLLLYALSLTPVAFFAPKIQARYLLVLLPAYVLLVALGVAFLRRLSIYLSLAAVLFLLGASVYVLKDYYADRRLEDEYATLVNTVNAFAQPGDMVLLDTDQEWPTFLYYLRAPMEWVGVPNGLAMTSSNAESLVARARARSRAVWLVVVPDALATDPQHLVESQLARGLSKQYERTVGDKRLVLYAAAARDWTHISPENLNAQFARNEWVSRNVQLVGLDLPVREVYGGDTLRVTTYWHAPSADQLPLRLAGLITTTTSIPSGDLVRVEEDLAIPPDAVGSFALELGSLNLAQIRIDRVSLDEPGPGDNVLPADALFGDSVRLVGYELPVNRFRAGETVSITLHWRAERPMATSYTAFVHVLGEQFNPAQNNPLWGQVDRIPRDGRAPTTAWSPGQIVRDPYNVRIDPKAPPGTYAIEVGLYDPATGLRLPVGDGDSAIVTNIVVE